MSRTSKTQIVIDFITKEIENGHFTPGTKLPPQSIITQNLNVGHSTFREATTNLVSLGILEKKHNSGLYVASKNGKGIICYISNVLSGITSHTSFKIHMMNNICKLINKAGYKQDLSYMLGYSLEDLLTRLDGIKENNDIKGLIIDFDPKEIEDKLKEINKPYVIIKSVHSLYKNSIVLEYNQMCAIACGMMHMHNHNNFHVMYIDYSNIIKAKDIYFNELIKSMVNKDENRLITIPHTKDLEEAYYEFKKWWEHVEKPAAIVFADDSLCSVASKAINELNIKIPEELAIITIGNLFSKYSTPVEYTKINIDDVMACQKTTDMIIELIENPDKEPTIEYIKGNYIGGNSI